MTRVLVAVLAAVLVAASPAVARAGGWTPVGGPVDAFVTDGARYAVWQPSGRAVVTVADTRTGRRRHAALPGGCGLRRVVGEARPVGVIAFPRLLLDCLDDTERVLDLRDGRSTPLPKGPYWWALGSRWAVARAARCRTVRSVCSRYVDLRTGAVRRLRAVPPRDLDAPGLARAPWCASLDAPLRTALSDGDLTVRTMDTALGDRAMLVARGAGRLALLRCGRPPRTVARGVGEEPYPQLGGGWASWSSGTSAESDVGEGPPAGIVGALRLRDGRRVAVPAPRRVVEGCDGARLRGAYGHVDHTATRLYWAATVRTVLGPADCWDGPMQLYVRRLPR